MSFRWIFGTSCFALLLVFLLSYANRLLVFQEFPGLQLYCVVLPLVNVASSNSSNSSRCLFSVKKL